MRDVRVFIDSNVLLYTRDEATSDKSERCAVWLRETLRMGVARTNLQVLNEITQVMLRKRRDLGEADIFASVDAIAFLATAAATHATTLSARRLRKATRYSWWDCLLLASALELGCTHFLSEDLQDGQSIAGLTIVDPFAHSPDHIFSSR